MSSFSRHVLEMTASMVIPFTAFFVVARVLLPATGVVLPAVVLIPVAILVMVVPMTAWMLHRRHAARDILEMNAAMFAGMIVLMPIARLALPALGIPFGFEQMYPAALVAMTAPMIALMFARRDRNAHHGTSHQRLDPRVG